MVSMGDFSFSIHRRPAGRLCVEQRFGRKAGGGHLDRGAGQRPDHHADSGVFPQSQRATHLHQKPGQGTGLAPPGRDGFQKAADIHPADDLQQGHDVDERHARRAKANEPNHAAFCRDSQRPNPRGFWQVHEHDVPARKTGIQVGGGV